MNKKITTPWDIIKSFEEKTHRCLSDSDKELLIDSIEKYTIIHLNKMAKIISEKAKVHQHSRDHKVSSISPIVRQKIMISEVHKESIIEASKEYIDKLSCKM